MMINISYLWVTNVNYYDRVGLVAHSKNRGQIKTITSGIFKSITACMDYHYTETALNHGGEVCKWSDGKTTALKEK